VRATLPLDLTGIVVELTEHELFGAEGELETMLAALRERGARVALDDAGAGYAGLQQIIRIAPDILKLDRALVHGAHADGSRQALLEALIGFAGTTGAAVCAEGVEDLEDVRALVALDVTYAQGYGLARPGPPWPAPLAEATDAGAAEIRGGLRVAIAPHGVAGAFASGMAELADELANATSIADLGAAMRSAAGILRADDVALMQVDRAADALVLVSDHNFNPSATRYVLDHRVPGQVVVGDAAGDPAELAELEALGMATLLIVPIVWGGRELAVLEVYRTLPQAFTAREVDRARVLSQQFGAVLDRLT
jgi:GAF domain-containing protein